LSTPGKPVRRIVTGHHADGRSRVLMDGAAPNVRRRQAGNASTLLWITDQAPALTAASDQAAREIGVPPPRCGSIFRVAEFPPGFGVAADGTQVPIADLALGQDIAPGHRARYPGIHRTRTIDYVTVLEGEIFLLLDDGEVRLKAGDVVVQQATNHAWVNRSAAVCRLAMVFIDAEEPDAVLRAQ
jgi:hypothetical protein